MWAHKQTLTGRACLQPPPQEVIRKVTQGEQSAAYSCTYSCTAQAYNISPNLLQGMKLLKLMALSSSVNGQSQRVSLLTFSSSNQLRRGRDYQTQRSLQHPRYQPSRQHPAQPGKQLVRHLKQQMEKQLNQQPTEHQQHNKSRQQPQPCWNRCQHTCLSLTGWRACVSCCVQLSLRICQQVLHLHV